MKTTTTIFAAALAAALALGAGAAEERFSYKGRLAKADGSAFDTSVSMPMSFRLYDVPAGGQALWGRDMPVRMEADGSFYVELSDGDGSAVSGTSCSTLKAALESATNLWIGLTPDGYSEILPRQPLAVAPRALSAAAAHAVDTVRAPLVTAGSLDVRSSATLSSLAVPGSLAQGAGTVYILVDSSDALTVGTEGGIKVTHSISGIRSAPNVPSGDAKTDSFVVLRDADGPLGGWCSVVVPMGAPMPPAPPGTNSSFTVTFGSGD